MLKYKKIDRLNLLRDAYEAKGRTQEQVATFLGLSRRGFIAWLEAEATPKSEKWKQKFIEFLLEYLELKEYPQQFHKIWNEVLVEVWNWEELTADEIDKLQLEPPLQLFLNVPARPLHHKIVGRDELLAAIKRQLLNREQLVLTGMPGVGKTLLAIELVRDPEVMKHYADGIVWVRLGQQPDVMGELTRLGEGLGLNITQLASEKKRYQAITNAIGRRHFLFIIDDVWHTGTEAVENYFKFDGPNCCHLLTTRDQEVARNFAQQNHIIFIPELEYEQNNNPSYELLSNLAPVACIADPDAARRLVATVGGLPLALVLLGGYLSNPERTYFAEESKNSLTEMNDPLRRLHLAQKRLGSLEDKNLTLQEVIALSLEALPTHIIKIFYALGSFAAKPERFDSNAAKAVTEADDKILSILIARNLLEIDQAEQLALHQVLADVARTRTPAIAIERHRTFYLDVIREERVGWQRIESLYGQVKQAWAVTPDDEYIYDFIDTIFPYQYQRGLWNDAVDWTRRGLQLAEAHEAEAYDWQKAVAVLLNNLGLVFTARGEWNQGIEYYQQSMAVWEQLGDNHSLAQTYNNLGNIYSNQSEWGKAIEFYQKGLTISDQLGDRQNIAKTYNNLGIICHDKGEWDLAVEYYQQSMAVWEQLGDKYGLAQTYNNLGLVYANKGKWEKAIEYHQQAQQTLEQLGDIHGLAQTYNNLAGVYQFRGEWDHAIKYHEQSMAAKRQLGDSHGLAQTYNNLGSVYFRKGEWEKAIENHQLAQQIFKQLGDIHGLAQTYNNLGNIYGNKGEWEKAIKNYQQAQQTFKQLGDIHDLAQTYNNLGNICYLRGEWNQAIEFYHQAHQIFEQMRSTREVAQIYTNLGTVYSSKGEHTVAAKMFELSSSIYRSLGDYPYHEANALNDLAKAYQQIGNYPLALASCEQALQLAHKGGFTELEVRILILIGITYSSLGDSQQALEFLYQITRQSGDTMIFDEKKLLSAIFEEKQKALQYYQQAWVLNQQLGNTASEQLICTEMINTFIDLGEFDKAKEQYERLSTLSKEYRNVPN